jgi:hypothetical protein
LLQLLVAAPYGANERSGSNAGVRGFLVGVMFWGFAIGPCYLATFCVIVRGSLHWRFALSIPITVGVSVGAAFVPVGDSMLGFLSIWLVTGAGAISLCVALINLPLCATHEHLQLDANFHVPYCALVFGFFGVLITHVELTRRSSIMAIGLVLPIGCLGAESMYNQIVKRTCSLYYYEPKSASGGGFRGGLAVECRVALASSFPAAETVPRHRCASRLLLGWNQRCRRC